MQATAATGDLVALQTGASRVLFLFRWPVLPPGSWREVAAAAAAVAMVYSRSAAIISARRLNDSTQVGFRQVINVSKLCTVLHNNLH